MFSACPSLYGSRCIYLSVDRCGAHCEAHCEVRLADWHTPVNPLSVSRCILNSASIWSQAFSLFSSWSRLFSFFFNLFSSCWDPNRKPGLFSSLYSQILCHITRKRYGTILFVVGNRLTHNSSAINRLHQRLWFLAKLSTLIGLNQIIWRIALERRWRSDCKSKCKTLSSLQSLESGKIKSTSAKTAKYQSWKATSGLVKNQTKNLFLFTENVCNFLFIENAAVYKSRAVCSKGTPWTRFVSGSCSFSIFNSNRSTQMLQNSKWTVFWWFSWSPTHLQQLEWHSKPISKVKFRCKIYNTKLSSSPHRNWIKFPSKIINLDRSPSQRLG